MEKAVVFGPMIIFFGFFMLLVFGFLFLVFKLIMKQKASFWTGKVVDKMHKQRRDFDNPHKIEDFYTLIIETDERKQLKQGISRQLYDQFVIGDKIKKEKSKLLPEKVI